MLYISIEFLEPPLSVSHTKTQSVGIIMYCASSSQQRGERSECDGNVRLVVVDLCGPIRGTMGGRSSLMVLSSMCVVLLFAGCWLAGWLDGWHARSLRSLSRCPACSNDDQLVAHTFAVVVGLMVVPNCIAAGGD